MRAVCVWSGLKFAFSWSGSGPGRDRFAMNTFSFSFHFFVVFFLCVVDFVSFLVVEASTGFVIGGGNCHERARYCGLPSLIHGRYSPVLSCVLSQVVVCLLVVSQVLRGAIGLW